MEKKYDHLVAEKQAQELWQQGKVYAAHSNPGPLFSIDTPPPTVSGALHIGHIFSYTQTDVLARYKRMAGFSVFYPFGFDDNGLPTERFVEKKQGASAYSIGRSAFIELCLKETIDVEKQFQELWQRIGLSVDWEACYSTISSQTRRISQASFIELHNKGYAYRKEEPALYCTTCYTSVAQAELDDVEHPSTFNDIIFKSGDQDLVIATTRPELLPSCVALFYHPSDARYAHLAGKNATVPLFEHQVPILADERVKPEKGTGLVMCCTFGDSTDIEWYKQYKLPYRQSIGRDGRFVASTGILAGLKVKPARAAIISALKEQNLLIKERPITHAVNVHERCKNEIEYIILSQWFLEILPHKDDFLKAADLIDWHPAYMKTRYINWVENINWDWCISRQRFFGIPFPAWHCTDCSTVITPSLDQLPIDPQETPYTGTCPQCSGSNIEADTDVMDTWNTSSLTPYICLEIAKKMGIPTDYKDFTTEQGLSKYHESTGGAQKGLYEHGEFGAGPRADALVSMRPQAHDIIRTWAFYTIVKTWLHEHRVPWESIVISGHVLSTEKQKISKSQGNSPLVPENLLKTYPADVIRYWTSTAQLGTDTAFSETQFGIGQRLLIKMWNAYLFMSAHSTASAGTAPANIYKPHGLCNTWLMHRATETYAAYTKHFDEVEYNKALDVIEKFFWHDLCDNYLELVKDQLFNPAAYSQEEVASTKETLYVIGLRMLQWFAPYMPHITETLYQELYKEQVGTQSLHQTRFANAQGTPFMAHESIPAMQCILNIVGHVRKLKSDNTLSLRQELSSLTIGCRSDQAEMLKQQAALIKGITHAHVLHIVSYQIETTLMRHESLWQATVSVIDSSVLDSSSVAESNA